MSTHSRSPIDSPVPILDDTANERTQQSPGVKLRKEKLPKSASSRISYISGSDIVTATQEVQVGYLYKKLLIDSRGKTAKDRTWKYLWVELHGCVINWYRNESYASVKGHKSRKPVEWAETREAVVGVAINYKKRPHVFFFRANDGREFLLQAKDDAEMQLWIDSLQRAVPLDKDCKPLPASTNNQKTLFQKLFKGKDSARSFGAFDTCPIRRSSSVDFAVDKSSFGNIRRSMSDERLQLTSNCNKSSQLNTLQVSESAKRYLDDKFRHMKSAADVGRYNPLAARRYRQYEEEKRIIQEKKKLMDKNRSEAVILLKHQCKVLESDLAVKERELDVADTELLEAIVIFNKISCKRAQEEGLISITTTIDIDADNSENLKGIPDLSKEAKAAIAVDSDDGISDSDDQLIDGSDVRKFDQPVNYLDRNSCASVTGLTFEAFPEGTVKENIRRKATIVQDTQVALLKERFSHTVLSMDDDNISIISISQSSMKSAYLDNVSHISDDDSGEEDEMEEMEPFRATAVALFMFPADNVDELSFSKGDRINITGKSGSEWFLGELNGCSGIFPVNFVKIEEATSDQDIACSSSVLAKDEHHESEDNCLIGHEAISDDELSLLRDLSTLEKNRCIDRNDSAETAALALPKDASWNEDRLDKNHFEKTPGNVSVDSCINVNDSVEPTVSALPKDVSCNEDRLDKNPLEKTPGNVSVDSCINMNDSVEPTVSSLPKDVSCNEDRLDKNPLGITPGNVSIHRYYSYDELIRRHYSCDFENLECYLSDADFMTYFQMDKRTFYSISDWKRKEKKKKLCLF